MIDETVSTMLESHKRLDPREPTLWVRQDQNIVLIRPPGARGRAAIEPVPVAPAERSAIPPGENVRTAEAETLHRLAVLTWFKGLDHRSRVLLRIAPIDPNSELSRGFVGAFGLSASEAAALQAAVRRANGRVNSLLAAAAKVRVEADNSRAWVELPAMPTEGGQIYDELLQTFKTTLGPERLPYFEEFAAESFESAFRTFGAKQSTYEVVRSRDGGGRTVFSVKESFTLPNHHGTNTSTADSEGLPKWFPVLAQVLPPSFTQEPARP